MTRKKKQQHIPKEKKTLQSERESSGMGSGALLFHLPSDFFISKIIPVGMRST
jgi:hypothetical protein